jgi:hypothetical protein
MADKGDQLGPPTVLDLKGMGLAGINSWCRNPDCRHSGKVSWDKLGVSDQTAFPAIQDKVRLRCSACGAANFQITPDWSGYRPSGSGIL